MNSNTSERIKDFPITPHLSKICQTIKASPSGFTILTAQTAAGKSTVLPLALLENFEGKILMTEPRRLAVLGVSARVSDLMEESVGQTVGYRIHLDKKISEKTRFEVATEAILVRMLQEDNILENYNLIVLDEFHERSINLDMALAFLKEAMLLRDDLKVVIMSATIETQKLQEYLSPDSNSPEQVPVIQIPGRQYEVEIKYEAEKKLENVIIQEFKQTRTGNILVFLPGIKEINQTKQSLLEIDSDLNSQIFILHSSIQMEEQKHIISDNNPQNRKIILSSAIAETSLTVPNITCVIDSGLCRINRMNVSSGMENLCTEKVSEFSAKQRSGRAGRVQNGRCIRLWNKNDVLQKQTSPEILRADLTQLVLECYDRGIKKNNGIDWLDKPSEHPWNTSVTLLQQLEMINTNGTISELGKAALKLGMHPRLAGIALSSFANGKLSDAGKELLLKYGSYATSPLPVQNRFITDLEIRLSKINLTAPAQKNSELLILKGYPDRLAKKTAEIQAEKAEYQFPSGRKAILYKSENAGFQSPEWIVAPEVLAGDREGKIFSFQPIDSTLLSDFFETHCGINEVCQFVQGKIQKTQNYCYGEIILSSKKIPTDPQDFLKAWENEIQTKGFDVVPKNEKLENFLLRADFFFQQNPELIATKLENLSTKEYLAQKVDQWLSPFLGNSTNLTEETVFQAVHWFLDGPEIDSKVPVTQTLPNGRTCKIKYEKISEITPVIEIIIQRVFGCFETPEICGKKILFRLLSPASRPLQITDDLAGFWNGAWIEICKEMKGRYPKHNWDYRIAEKD